VDTGIPGCDITEWSLDLPLPSPKTLWEAKNRVEWEAEYSTHCATHDHGVYTMGMLIEAHKHSDDPAKSQILDYWNSRADNLGNLLNIVASMG
jgi:hypothetical protein